MEEIYLDNSATTRVCEKSAEKVLELMTQCYGNRPRRIKRGWRPKERSPMPGRR